MKVLVADELSAEGLDVLRKAPGLTVDVRTGLKPAELKALVGEFDVLAVRSATKVTADVLENPGKLKLIGRAGVGVDNIDVEAATRKGVTVMNTPRRELGGRGRAHPRADARPAPAPGPGDHRHQDRQVGEEALRRPGTSCSARRWAWSGSATSASWWPSAAWPSGPRSSPTTRTRWRPRGGWGCRSSPSTSSSGERDIVSLHLPLVDNTRNLVGARLLGSMKRGSYLINCARGGIVDEAALAEALRNGTLAGAAMDVFATEPVARGPPAPLPGQLPLHPASRGLDRGGAAGLRAPARRAAGGVRPDRTRPERPQRTPALTLAPRGRLTPRTRVPSRAGRT